MTHLRLRQPRWIEWDGNDFPAIRDTVYFSYGRIDLTRAAHVRKLIDTLHRDGVIASKDEGYRAMDSAVVTEGWVTYVGEDVFLTYYVHGEEYEDVVDPEPATWVELDLGDY